MYVSLTDLVKDMNSHYLSSYWAKFKHNNQPKSVHGMYTEKIIQYSTCNYLCHDLNRGV